MTKLKIYFASPLFNKMEQTYNKTMVSNIRNKFKHEVDIYLPQENEAINDKSGYADSKMIAIGDNKELLDSDLLIAVLDGQTIDNGVASEIGIAHALGIPTIALYTDTRQGTFGNEDKIKALDTIAESQFSYINLYTVGLIKSTNEIHQNALQNNGIYNDIKDLYCGIEYFINLKTSIKRNIKKENDGSIIATVLSTLDGVKVYRNIDTGGVYVPLTIQAENYLTRNQNISKLGSLNNQGLYEIKYRVIMNKEVSPRILFGTDVLDKQARLFLRNIHTIYNSFLLGSYSKSHYINEEKSLFVLPRVSGGTTTQAHDNAKPNEYYVDGFHYDKDGKLKTQKHYRFGINEKDFEDVQVGQHVLVPGSNNIADPDEYRKPNKLYVISKGILTSSSYQPTQSILELLKY